MSIRLQQINLHHSKAASAVHKPLVVGGKVTGLVTKEDKLMLDPKKGKIRTCILAKRHLSIFLLRNYSNGDNTAVSMELQSGSIRVLSAALSCQEQHCHTFA